MVYAFFDRKTKGSGIKNEIKQDQQLAEELRKPIIRKFKNKKIVFRIQRQYLGC